METNTQADWQWEQGRAEYFQFENIRSLSRILAEKEGMLLSDPQENADLRARMREATGLEFKPDKREYSVWRNYGRVFQAALLATASSDSAGHRSLICTDLCRAIAEDRIESATDYILCVARSFYLPGPAFGADKFRSDERRVFPFCAVLRLLLAKSSLGSGFASVSAEDVKDYLFRTGACGDEDWNYYAGLGKRSGEWKNNKGDQKRQIREMLIFAAQSAFLKWDPAKPGRLFLDLPPWTDESELRALFTRISPIKKRRRDNVPAEILSMGAWRASAPTVPLFTPNSVTMESGLIAPGEGARRRVNHLVIERSPKLREIYFSRIAAPICDITGAPPDAGFPWASNLLEIHHVMPLSSSTRADAKGATLMDDLVALTPTSHRAVHVFYRQWLRKNRRQDFADRGEAWKVYKEAKREYRQHHGIPI